MAREIKREFSVEERYGFIKKIGSGTYGDAWIVVPIDQIAKGTLFVLKRLNLQSTGDNAQEGAEQEAKLLATLKHPNIIRYIESFRSWDLYLNIVMCYCEGGDLYTKIRAKESENEVFEATKVIEWCIQICMALQYIHERHIVHRDLKTQNIFLTKHEIIKVGDFGISRVLDGAEDLATTIIGTPYYMSPEMFSNKPYDQKSDIWSLGCCMYELVNLQTAFEARNINSLVMKIIRGATPEIQGNYSDELKKIIKDMLSKQPHHRPTATDILNNKYIKQHIVRMLEVTKQRVKNTAERKQQRKRNHSTLPPKSEFTDQSATNSIETMSLTDSYPSESRTRRRQKIAAQQQPTFHSTDELTTEAASNVDGVLMNSDPFETRNPSPVTKLSYYFEQDEKENQGDLDHVQMRNDVISTLNLPPITNANTKSEVITSMRYRPMPAAHGKRPADDENKMNGRYFDIGILPKQVLLPITGYDTIPLTSLEGTLRSVGHLLPDMDRKIIVARQNAEQWHGILSVEESAAIQLYTMETFPLDRCLYYNLNKTLRSANRRELVPWFPYLKLLMTALWKLPSIRRTVWRGIKDVDLSSEYQEGQRYTWWNLSSCSDALSLMQTSQFLGNQGLRTLFIIECENGREIKEHSYLKDENEILLPPARYIEVLGKVNPAVDLHLIHVREITPPYELISPPF